MIQELESDSSLIVKGISGAKKDNSVDIPCLNDGMKVVRVEQANMRPKNDDVSSFGSISVFVDTGDGFGIHDLISDDSLANCVFFGSEDGF
jgi:hypothetical protein